MHWRVLPSPCSMPIPNLASAPRKAISSVTICPVLMNATDSLPCASWIALNRSTNAARRDVPLHALQLPARVPEERRGGAIGRAERRERLPALRARHPEVHGIVGGRREVDRLAVLEVHVQPAPGRAEPAHDRRRLVGLEPRRHLPRPNSPGVRSSSRVSGPLRCKRRLSACLGAGDVFFASLASLVVIRRALRASWRQAPLRRRGTARGTRPRGRTGTPRPPSPSELQSSRRCSAPRRG